MVVIIEHAHLLHGFPDGLAAERTPDLVKYWDGVSGAGAVALDKRRAKEVKSSYLFESKEPPARLILRQILRVPKLLALTGSVNPARIQSVTHDKREASLAEKFENLQSQMNAIRWSPHSHTMPFCFPVPCFLLTLKRRPFRVRVDEDLRQAVQLNSRSLSLSTYSIAGVSCSIVTLLLLFCARAWLIWREFNQALLITSLQVTFLSP